jgi:hypothetical protein
MKTIKQYIRRIFFNEKKKKVPAKPVKQFIATTVYPTDPPKDFNDWTKILPH